ncbi:MAG: ATP-dependent 6-phosphofructokinase [Anaerolineae bacterium]|nr:6-phosphofructokinase [Thermoflexales bacterium]MDW8395234.1 ATP-dependent 6-phosphofructokinase [Anaerolineae bacterium]
MRRIAVITSGGDVPGLNACIRAVTRTALHYGCEVIGIRRGYEGLMNGEFVSLDSRSVAGILRQGGTMLGTARSERFMTEEGRRAALEQLRSAGIEGMVVIGGNGSLAGAYKLYEMGFPLVGVPKTIDNDQYGTDTAIGVDTALNTIADAVGRIKDTATSHHRAFLIEVMGRNCGYLALASGIICGAEMALIPERPATLEQVAHTIVESYRIGKAHCIIMVAEGWKPGLRALKDYLCDTKLNERFDVREVVLGHIQRGGTPTAFDRLLATRMGVRAVESLLDGSGIGKMVALRGAQSVLVDLKEATSQPKPLPEELLRIADMLCR